MNSAFYNGLSGVHTTQFGIESWSNNIANINTNGYKSQTPEFSTIFSTAIEGLNANSPISNDKGYGSSKGANAIDLRVGSFLDADDSPLNMAISQQGWFVVGTSNGNISYTRDGAFSQDSTGHIVNNSGQYLYGVNLNKINGNILAPDYTDEAVALSTETLNSTSEVSALTTLQIPEGLLYPSKATTQVYSAMNLNPTSSLKDIASSFNSYPPDTTTSMSTIAGFQGEDTLSVTVDGTVTQLTYGTDFTTAGEFMSALTGITGLKATYNEEGEIIISNDTANLINVSFTCSTNTPALVALGLSTSATPLAVDGSLPPLTTPIPLSTTLTFNQFDFRLNDMDTLFKEEGSSIGLKTGDTLNISVTIPVGDPPVDTTTNSSIIYGTDFTTIDQFMSKIETITGLRASVDESNNALKFSNDTATAIDLSFSSNNNAFTSVLALPSTTSIAQNASLSTTALKIPAYNTSIAVYDASGTKHLLNSTYTLTSKEPQTWSVQSGIYDFRNTELVSPTLENGSLTFDSLGSITSAPILSLAFPDGGTSTFDPSQDKLFADGKTTSIVHQTTGASYMASQTKQNNQNGNTDGYMDGLSIDGNGIISLSFSNGKFETFGRVGIAGFINAQGLHQSDNTLFTQTGNSGAATLLWNWGTNTGTLRGTEILSGKLESSNVDLATALTELMVFQRSYSANTKSITIADEMVRDAIGLIK